MHIISIGLDSKTTDPESVVAKRNSAYGAYMSSYTVFVPTSKTVVVHLSEKTVVYGIGGGNKIVQFIQMYLKLSALIKTKKYDIITTQDTYFLGLLGVLLSKRYHLGLEVQVLGIEKLTVLRKIISKFILTRAGSIRVLSQGLKKRLIQEFGVSEERMMLVPIYVDVSSLGFNTIDLSESKKTELEKENKLFLDSYGDRLNIVSVNRLVPIKNISMQLQAIASLKSEFPKILLHIVGDGPLKAELQKEIEQCGIKENVILHGFKSGVQLSPFFTQSNCLVLTSDFEGYGMVIVEAATAGLPVVMTDVGCAGEIIINQESGMIVPPRDTKAFTEALRMIMKDETVRDRLSKGALQSIAQLPSFDTVLEKYKASWEQAFINRL